MPPASVILKRVVVSMLIGLVIGVAVSEITFVFLKETARPPESVLLSIPAGTAESIARGKQPPSLPANMVFVVGDTLIVENHDSVDHQLGPLWIPAGASANLQLGTEENVVFQCSFQTTNYLGLDVRQSLTPGTRIYGILFAGIPLGVLIALYSIIMPARRGLNKAVQQKEVQ